MAEVTRKPLVILSEKQNVANGATATFKAKEADFIDCWYDKISPGVKQVPTGVVFDPLKSTASVAGALIDGDLLNLSYNNLITVSSGEPQPGIDLGAPKNIAQVDIYWWSITYYMKDFRIEYSNDNISWSSAGTFVGNFVGAGVPESFFFPTINARYWRTFCINGNNGNYAVISEMEVFSPSGAAIPVKLEATSANIIANPSGNIEITNNTGSTTDITVNSHG